MRSFCYPLLLVVIALLLLPLSTLARPFVLVLTPEDLSDAGAQSSDSAADGGDASDWDEFGDSDTKPDDELDPGSWRPILDPDSGSEPATEDEAVYYSGVGKVIAAASSGGPRVMEEAASEIEAAATAGNPHAQSALGFLYEMGMTKERNKAKAFMYHYFAADGGNTQSKMALAYTYSRQDVSETLAL